VTIEEFLAEMREHEAWRWEGEIDIHSHDSTGDTPLHWALWRSDDQLTKALVEAGVDVNSRGEDGFTPLHVAVAQENAAMARYLAAAGASWGAVNEFGQSPLERAKQADSPEMRQLALGAEPI